MSRQYNMAVVITDFDDVTTPDITKVIPLATLAQGPCRSPLNSAVKSSQWSG